MSLFDVFKKKDAADGPRSPYSISSSLTPYRLHANRKDSVTMTVRVKNLTRDNLMTSVELEVPGALSFDDIGLVKRKGFRLGSLAPDEEKEFSTNVNGSVKTDKGEYTMSIVATAHYMDYDHVVNKVTTSHAIGVV
jgi:hypothetical protein